MKILIHWLVLTLAILAAHYVMPANIKVDTFMTAVVAAAVLMFINSIVKPVISVLTLPINIITLGLFSLVLNGLFLWFVASIINGFSITDFKTAFLGALVVAVINWIGDKVLVKK